VNVVGRHNFSIYFDALYGGGNMWFNQSYYISFGIYIDIPEQKGLSMEVKGISNVDCEWYVYNIDDAAWTGESGSIVGGNDYFQFLFLLETSSGMHNYSLYFNASSIFYVWKNGTYQVDTTYAFGEVTIYNSRGTGFDPSKYIVYVNGTRYFDNRFYNRTDYVYNITVTDYFNDTVYSSVIAFNRFIDVGLEFYTYKVYSEHKQFIYFNLTSSGGARYSQHLGPGEILTYYLVSGEYVYTYKTVNTDLLTYDFYSGTSTVNQDTAYIISGVSLQEIYNAIINKIDVTANIAPAMAALVGVQTSLGALQTGLWILAFIIVGAMVFVGYFRDEKEITMTDGTGKKKKRKQPSWLARFSFGKGDANPQSQRIPKSAGRSSWKGVVFKDEGEN